MSVNIYAGPGLLSARGTGTIAVTLTLASDGTRWSGEARPADEGAVFPAWVREGLVVSLRVNGGGTSQARVSFVSLDRSRPWPR